MSGKALQIIEEVYEIALNPELPYGAQLEPLAASGELANRISTNKVLFRLCELVDLQAKEIKSLKEDREAIAKEMVRLSSQFGNQAVAKEASPIENVAPDPTKPIDVPPSNPTQSDTNADLQS